MKRLACLQMESPFTMPWTEANNLLIQTTPLQILEEGKYLLENLANFDTMYWGDHGNNIVSLRGRLPASRELFLKKIDHAIADHPVTEQDVLLTSPW